MSEHGVLHGADEEVLRTVVRRAPVGQRYLEQLPVAGPHQVRLDSHRSGRVVETVRPDQLDLPPSAISSLLVGVSSARWIRAMIGPCARGALGAMAARGSYRASADRDGGPAAVSRG